MSQALAQSVSALVDNRQLSLREIVVKNATKAVTGVTRQRLFLNASKLMNACRDEYKSRKGIEKVKQLPDEVNNALQEEVTKFINENINRIHAGNSLTFRTSDYLDYKNLRVTERLNAVGENLLDLQAQLEGAHRMQRVASDKLKLLEKWSANGNSQKDYSEQIKSAEKRIAQLAEVEMNIRSTIAEIKKAQTEQTPSTEAGEQATQP